MTEEHLDVECWLTIYQQGSVKNYLVCCMKFKLYNINSVGDKSSVSEIVQHSSQGCVHGFPMSAQHEMAVEKRIG